MRQLLVLVLVALLLAPFAAAQGRSGAVPPTPTPGAGGEDVEDDDRDARDEDEDRGRSVNERGRGRDRQEDPGPAAIGSFALSAADQSVQGDFVDFSYNATTLRAFRVGGEPLFDLVVAGPPTEDGEEVVARGAQLRLDTPFYSLRVHDNPAAVVKLETDGVATLLFRASANLTQLDGERVAFELGNLTGILRGQGLRVAGPSVIGDGEMLVLVHRPMGGFDTHRPDIGKAIAKRQVGAEASFNKREDGVQEDVVSYGNVTIHTVKAEQGNLTVLVDGHGFDGRVVVLNVDGRVIGAAKRDDLNVLFDNETIRPADDIQDVLDPDNDGLHPEYYVIFDPETESFQLLLSVPHYSVHSISVMTFVQVPPPSVVAGILGGLLVLAASGAALFRRPKA